jgi:hypothetical protein
MVRYIRKCASLVPHLKTKWDEVRRLETPSRRTFMTVDVSFACPPRLSVRQHVATRNHRFVPPPPPPIHRHTETVCHTVVRTSLVTHTHTYIHHYHYHPPPPFSPPLSMSHVHPHGPPLCRQQLDLSNRQLLHRPPPTRSTHQGTGCA